ncbi:hypothetical protein [Winogradskyella vidalii]|uniref:hypothetical protein n=1 Tax=Winogradskyella vidalii TaxID=2615024 RepID=UPI0015CCAB18|nr:hypothetical protein [Winogradskyella vidalii]
MFYILLLVLKVYCIYHAFKNNKPFYWYLIIFIIPIIGPLLYIITQVYNRNDTQKIQEEITTVLNPTKRIKDLEAKLKFTDTYANRIDLADAYYANKDFEKAVVNYNITLEDTVQDALYARQKLILSHFQLGNYADVITQAEFIKDKNEFKGSKQQFCYGLALNELGKVNEAEAQLKQIDRPYSNYVERLELAKFYVQNDKTSEGKALLNEISIESKSLTQPNRKLYGATIVEVERMLASIK